MKEQLPWKMLVGAAVVVVAMGFLGRQWLETPDTSDPSDDLGEPREKWELIVKEEFPDAGPALDASIVARASPRPSAATPDVEEARPDVTEEPPPEPGPSPAHRTTATAPLAARFKDKDAPLPPSEHREESAAYLKTMQVRSRLQNLQRDLRTVEARAKEADTPSARAVLEKLPDVRVELDRLLAAVESGAASTQESFSDEVTALQTRVAALRSRQR